MEWFYRSIQDRRKLMEIKDNELIVTFLEEDNFVNTFTFFAEEDSGEFLTDIYHDFMK